MPQQFLIARVRAERIKNRFIKRDWLYRRIKSETLSFLAPRCLSTNWLADVLDLINLAVFVGQNRDSPGAILDESEITRGGFIKRG